MTRLNDGKKDARIQNRDEAATQVNCINLEAHAKAISVLLTLGLTIFLAYKGQYLYSLCGAALTMAAATSDRLKRIRISLHGIHSEWLVGGKGRPFNRRKPPECR
jgi:hypothetical protein